MKIIVGLGNPGLDYQNTRHNAGFMLVDHLADKFNLSLGFDKKFEAEFVRSEIIQNGVAEDLCLFKPMAFMNRSGESLQKFLAYYYSQFFEEDEGNHLIVAHDDLDLSLGKYSLQKGKGPKQHNGLNSIYQQLGHKNFWHLRLGVDSRAGARNIPSSDYVLMKMNETEQVLLQAVITEVAKELLA